MKQNSAAETAPDNAPARKTLVLFPVIFLLVTIGGLFIVKWNPYYDRAFMVAASHSLGASIITGKGAAAPAPSWAAALGYATAYFAAVWKAVVLGLLLGSLVQVLIPGRWIARAFGGRNLSSAACAGVASLPGMMCSCCAAPVTAGLRARAASVGSALAFFLGNPVLNPATIVFMGFVLSWKFALFRIVAGIIMVFGIAVFADRIAGDEPAPAALPGSEAEEDGANWFGRWLKALGRLVIDTIPAYLIVVFILGAARAWLFPAVGPEWGDSILAVTGLAIAGTLFVIPTAAEIPVIQTLMAFGLGVGPAAALLMTLPAVSLPSILILKNAFPLRVLLFVLAAVAVIGIVSGIIAPLVL